MVDGRKGMNFHSRENPEGKVNLPGRPLLRLCVVNFSIRKLRGRKTASV
jgi:hypothetical protein